MCGIIIALVPAMPRRRVYDDALAGMEGALCDVTARKLLDACRERRITGVLRLTSWGRAGGIQIRAGQIEQVFFGSLRDDDALAELLALRDGMFEIREEMPDLARARSPHPGRTALTTLMRQCRERLLSCTITVIRDRERAELFYCAGELLYSKVNGITYEADAREAVHALERFEHGCARVGALPFALTSQVHTPRAEAIPISVTESSSRPALAPRPRPKTARPPRPPTARGTPAKGVPPTPPRVSVPRVVHRTTAAPRSSHPLDDATVLTSQDYTLRRSRGLVRPALLILTVLGLILLAFSLMAAPF